MSQTCAVFCRDAARGIAGSRFAQSGLRLLAGASSLFFLLTNELETCVEPPRGCVAGGGDGYTMIRGLRCLINPEEGPVEPATIINILAAEGEIAPRTDGRI